MPNNSQQRWSITGATFLFLACLQSVAAADPIQISWIDNQGDAGHFVWDTSQGFSPSAISEFSYIFDDGSPTPAGYIPNTFTVFNNGSSWDLNTGSEGVSMTFSTAFTAPLPVAPSAYDSAFASGNFITQIGTRTWNDITVNSVPEPCSTAGLFFASCVSFLYRRRARCV